MYFAHFLKHSAMYIIPSFGHFILMNKSHPIYHTHTQKKKKKKKKSSNQCIE